MYDTTYIETSRIDKFIETESRLEIGAGERRNEKVSIWGDEILFFLEIGGGGCAFQI